MIRCLSACVVLTVAALPASANFGIFRRPVEVVRASYYYVPPTYYAPPVVCVPPAAGEAIIPAQPPFTRPLSAQPPPPPGAPVPPLNAVPNRATPQPAPASPADQLPPLRPAPAVMPPAQPENATANKVEESYFNVYNSAAGARAQSAGRKEVTFWNLSGAALTLKIDGQNQVLPAKSSQTFQLPGAFAWRVEGREAEAGRVPADETGVTIVIRR